MNELKEKRLGNLNGHTGGSFAGQVYDPDGLAQSLTTMGGGGRQPHIMIKNVYIAACRGRNPDNPSDRTTGSPTKQRLEIKTDGITNTITTVAKDNWILEEYKDEC